MFSDGDDSLCDYTVLPGLLRLHTACGVAYHWLGKSVATQIYIKKMHNRLFNTEKKKHFSVLIVCRLLASL